VAQRKTKAQKQASLRAKERAAKRAIALFEVAASMRRAGFDEPTIMGYIADRRLPEWVHPDHFDPLRDDDEEEDDY